MRFLSIKKVAQLRDIVKSVQMNYNIVEKAHKISDFWPKSLAFSEKIWYNIEWKVPLKNAPKGGAHVP